MNSQESIPEVVSKKPAAGRCVVRYPDVLAVVQRSKAREKVLDIFASCGGDKNRWNASDKRIMANALSRLEDWMEMDHPMYPERSAVKSLRRKLEI